MELFLDIFISSLFTSAPLILATFAIVLIFKTSFTTNFAQGMIGTIAGFITSYMLLPNPDFTNPTVPSPTLIEYLFAIMVGIIVSFIISMIIDVLIFRHSRYLNPVGKQIITMGMVLVITGFLPMLFGVDALPLPRMGKNIIDSNFGKFLNGIVMFFADLGIRVRLEMVLTTLISIIILGIIFALLRFSKWGLGVRATASNEKVASMMGVNTKFITAMSWAIAGGLGAVAAIIISSNRDGFYVTPYLMISTQVQAFFSAILGGFSTFYGPVVGALLFTIFDNLFAVYLNPWGKTATYLFIMVIVLIKPYGLFGKKIAKKV